MSIANHSVSLCLVVLALSVQSSLAQELIKNGSFEKGGELSDPIGLSLRPGAHFVHDWVIGGFGVDCNGTICQAAEGQRSIDLDSSPAVGRGPYQGFLSQTIPTVVGKTYVVRFDLSGNPDGPPILKGMEVSAAGMSKIYNVITTNVTRRDMKYTKEEFRFVAKEKSTILIFRSLSGTGYGCVIDNVSVTPAVREQ